MTVNSYDELGICNNALILIGQNLINSIADPTTDTEAICARLYKMTVATILSRHDWNFCNPVAQLAHNADVTPVNGYIYAFKLPSDLIAGPFAVYTAADINSPVQQYVHANDHIHTNEPTCYVRYRKLVPVETWPEYIIDLVATALASRLAKPVADDSEMATELRIQAYGNATENMDGGLMKIAKTIDAMSQPNKTLFHAGNPLTGLVR